MLDMAARRKLDDKIPDMPEIKEPGILLTFYPEQREYGWHTWIHLAPETIRFGTNEFHLHSVLPDSKTESSIPANKEYLETVWRMAHILGYTVSKKNRKGKNNRHLIWSSSCPLPMERGENQTDSPFATDFAYSLGDIFLSDLKAKLKFAFELNPTW